MPAISIDTFFACSLLVSVALLATASLAGTMQDRLTAMQDLNKDDYLRNIAEHLVTSCGTPVDWGSAGTVPSSLGLADSESSYLYELDIDKISSLNNENSYALSYAQASASARLNNIALGISVSQMLSITTTLSANSSLGDETAYTFEISVSQASGPTSATLQCYVVTEDSVNAISNTTSNAGVGYITVQILNASNGPALLVVFARATFDDRITAYETYSFAHLSQEPSPNHTFLGLSPLNSTLSVEENFPDVTVEHGYAFSYAYQSNLTSTSASTYAIPEFVDNSPTVLVISAVNDTTPFVEWTAYPDIPLDFGSDFENAERNVFVYTVLVKGALYKLTLSFGDVIQ
ncbi:hypothetical protein JW988_08575 [Candidatus Bathyarchaeota archaeon]|nr:hypothetical protein [Candidatus Bathyarchaeota archaeon]